MAELGKLDLGKIVPSFKVGTVTVDETGANPAVTTTVENGVDVTLDFKLPKGEKGVNGDKGTTFTPAVAANGDLSWSNNGGLSNPATVNVKGPKGSAYKPTVDDEGNLTWAVTDDASAITGSVNIKGPQGVAGKDFAIAKVYNSVAAMNADFSNTAIPVGSFVVINIPLGDGSDPNATDVNNPDNAKMYVKADDAYRFVTDMSGAEGIQGPQGYTFTPAVSSEGVLSWTTDAPTESGVVAPASVNVKGPKGDDAITPKLSVDTTEGSATYGHLFVTYDPTYKPGVSA